MPADDIQVKRIPAVRVAELTATAASLEPASIGPVIQPLYQELGRRLGRAGLVPAGPAIAYYQDAPDGDGVLVHATLPVNADPGGGHGFEVTDLPEIGQAATIVHRGSMDNVLATIQILARWIDGNGYRSAGNRPRAVPRMPRRPGQVGHRTAGADHAEVTPRGPGTGGSGGGGRHLDEADGVTHHEPHQATTAGRASARPADRSISDPVSPRLAGATGRSCRSPARRRSRSCR